MSHMSYRSIPEATDAMPSGIPFIVGNEAAERFSFYGMKAILFTFMTTHMVNAAGAPDHLTEPEAKAFIHTFVAALYALPILGAIAADGWLGKYRVILALSAVYCAGHAILAVNTTQTGLILGLAAILRPTRIDEAEGLPIEIGQHIVGRHHPVVQIHVQLGMRRKRYFGR